LITLIKVIKALLTSLSSKMAQRNPNIDYGEEDEDFIPYSADYQQLTRQGRLAPDLLDQLIREIQRYDLRHSATITWTEEEIYKRRELRGARRHYMDKIRKVLELQRDFYGHFTEWQDEANRLESAHDELENCDLDTSLDDIELRKPTQSRRTSPKKTRTPVEALMDAIRGSPSPTSAHRRKDTPQMTRSRIILTEPSTPYSVITPTEAQVKRTTNPDGSDVSPIARVATPARGGIFDYFAGKFSTITGRSPPDTSTPQVDAQLPTAAPVADHKPATLDRLA